MGPYLPPVSVDQQQGGVIRGLTLLQLLNALPQLVLHRLPLLQVLGQLLVLELQHLQVHLLLDVGGQKGDVGRWGARWEVLWLLRGLWVDLVSFGKSEAKRS